MELDEKVINSIASNFSTVAETLISYRETIMHMIRIDEAQKDALIELDNRTLLMIRILIPICFLFSLVGMIAGLFALFG